MNIKEARKWLEELAEIRMCMFEYKNDEPNEIITKHISKFLEKYSILDLLIIKISTDSIIVKLDIEDELKRRIEDATKNND